MVNKTIAIVINTSWNIYNFRLGLLKALQANGYKIIVIAPHDKYSQEFISLGFEYYPLTINSKGTHPVEDLKLTYSFYKLYKQIQPDVILHYTIKPNIYGTFAAALLNIPTINNIAGLGTLFVKQDIVTSIAKMLYKLSQSKAQHVFFQNNDDIQQFINDKLVTKEKCSVLPGSGIDTNKYMPREKIDNGKTTFLLIARMLWEKGIGEYVEAARQIRKKYPNCEFQLLGFLDVANRSAIAKEQMQQWEDEGVINYLGITDDVPSFIAQADCVVLPSFYREGTPRTLLESASMAKPIITTDNVGCRDVVDDGINGYICKPQDTKSLEEQIEKFLSLDQEKILLMGEKSREKMIREYDESIVIEKYNTAISKIF